MVAMRRVPAAFALVGAALALPAHGETTTLKPDGPWNVDFGDKRCLVTRFFGEPDNRHILILDQYRPDHYFGLAVAGPRFSQLSADKGVSLRFFEGQDPITRQPGKGKLEAFGAAYLYERLGVATNEQPATGPQPIRARMPALDTDSAKQVRFVSLSAKGEEIRLATGPLDDVFQVLNQCTLDLVGSWGLDVEQHRTATRMPHWVNEAVMASQFMSLFPFERINSGERGRIWMRVILDESGKMEDCRVIEAPNIKLVERRICKAMGKAQFEPGLDANGQPMRSFFATTIAYQAD